LTLHRWLFKGDLHDPFSEFFVSVDPTFANAQYVPPPGNLMGDVGLVADSDGEGLPRLQLDVEAGVQRESGLRLWEGKYKFRKEMLPSFVGEAFGKKVGHFLMQNLQLSCF
jgi:gamma-tubulin complex component 3